MLIDAKPVTDIAEFGRWASVPSAREYLRLGEVFLIRMKSDVSSSVWANIDAIAKVGVKVFEASDTLENFREWESRRKK